MNKKEIFKIWAPTNSLWTEYIKPIPFIQVNETNKSYIINDINLVLPNYLTYQSNTAIIVDLPSIESVKVGLNISLLGYRPIPIYNGTTEQKNSQSTVDNTTVGMALIKYTETLKNINLDNNANPVLLLDTNRLNQYKANKTIYDNSWDIYPQDIPTKDYFLIHNINKIIVVSNKLNNDLAKVLYKYQKDIEIQLTNTYDVPKKIKIKKPKGKEEL